MMKKAVILGEREADLVEVPDPEPKEDWALVKVHAAPMCTEYKAFVVGYRIPFLGHEAAGEVVAIAQPGRRCTARVEVGDRVVVMPQYPCGKCELCVAGDFIHCQNNYDVQAFLGTRDGTATYAQYLLKPSWLLPKIPDGVSYELASLACCGLGPTFGACDAMDVDAFDTVLITGLGAVGLGGVVNAKFRGARVIGVESIPYRVERAKMLGADVVLDPTSDDAGSAMSTTLAQVMDLTGGRGVDKSIDCSGAVAAERFCVDATRRKGQVAFAGECRDELKIRISPDMIRKGLTILGVWHYNLSLFPKVMQVIQESPVIKQLISHVLPMSQIQEAFELSASHECAKIILKPWE
jgi:threonine dehydrogenase-like Zn-dependent dehydrogenase